MGVIGFSLDVTERRLAQERIEAYSKEWAETFDSMSDGVSIHTPAYTIIDVNQALCQLLGKKKQEIIGKRCFEVFHGKDSFPEICPLAHLKNTLKKEYVEFFETNINRWLSVSVSPILNKKNELVKIVHVIRDITERKQLEQMKDDFVSTVSHELRTPLAIMKEGIAQVVEGMHGDVNAKQKKFLGLSLGGIDRLTRIVTNLLDISKIEAGKVQLRLEKVDIVSLARGVGAGFAPAFKGKGIELRYNFAKEKVELYIDKEKIIEVFTNLISNALKFTERGYVEICVSEDIDIVECSVTDTGIGLSEEFLPRVFSKFEQFGKDIGHAERGAGLGLSICKGIIELHKGKIWIESKLGQGTKVSFLLLKEKTV
jgi:PAS domain S-box-containing protein